ncbi:SPW repeat protein [Nocardioides pocheonensis]|nr:SPW repeat protein [Nocardioides pocheonensis]
MQKWTRWQDWVTLVAGAYAALAPLWTKTENKATWTMVVLGVVTVAVSLWALAMPEDRISEYGLVLLGVLFIASPWVMSFDNLDRMALTAWIVGAVTLIFGVLALPQIDQRMHRTPIPH